jgi:predicted site-specific integrase-resolvase
MEVYLYSETDMNMNDEWLPINVAARMLGISGQAIRNWVRQGKLRCRVQLEQKPRQGTQYKVLKHVSWKDLTCLHEEISRARAARIK